MFLAVVAFIFIDVMLIIFIDAITVSSRLCEMRLNELSDDLEKKHGTEQQTRQQLRIILMQTKFIDGQAKFQILTSDMNFTSLLLI